LRKKPSLGGVGAACNPNNYGVNLSSLGADFSYFGNPTILFKKLEERNTGSGVQSGCCGKRQLSLNDALIAQEWSDDLICVGPILARERDASRVGTSSGATTATMCVFSR